MRVKTFSLPGDVGFCLVAILVSLSAGKAFAGPSVASGPPVTSVFLFNAGELLNGTIALEHEVALTRWFGLSSGFLLNVFPGVFAPKGQSSFVAFGPELTARFHFIQDAPLGLWIGPSLYVAYLASNGSGNPRQLFGYGLSGTIGYNFQLSAHVVLQVGGGAGFRDFGDGLMWLPRIHLGVGVAI